MRVMMERTDGGRDIRGWRLAAATAVAALTVLVMVLPVSCSDECTSSSECPAGQYCFQGSCRPLGGVDADADADVVADADGVTPTDGDADPDVVPDDGAVPDVPVCGCTRHADCPPSTIPCTHFVCNAETGCCDSIVEVPNYCAAGPGPTYCEGAIWCLGGVEMAGTEPAGTSRCEDDVPSGDDNCDIDGSSECALIVTMACPW